MLIAGPEAEIERSKVPDPGLQRQLSGEKEPSVTPGDLVAPSGRLGQELRTYVVHHRQTTHT